MHSQPESRDPIGQAVDLVVRTLRILYIAFWATLAIYIVVLLVVLPLTRAGSPTPDAIPEKWTQWQLFFGIAGIALLYLSQRLRGTLIDPKSIHKRIPAASGPDALPIATALTQVMARTVSGHVFLWCLVEVPALLGVIDRLISGELRYLAALAAMSAIGLASHRPSRNRVEETFAPLRGARAARNLSAARLAPPLRLCYNLLS